MDAIQDDDVYVAAAAPRLVLTEYSRRRPRRRRDSSPRTIHVPAAASPRLVPHGISCVPAAASLRVVSTEYSRRGRGASTTRLRGISASQSRRRRDLSPQSIHSCGVAATHRHGLSASRPRRRRDSSPQNIAFQRGFKNGLRRVRPNVGISRASWAPSRTPGAAARGCDSSTGTRRSATPEATRAAFATRAVAARSVRTRTSPEFLDRMFRAAPAPRGAQRRPVSKPSGSPRRSRRPATASRTRGSRRPVSKRPFGRRTSTAGPGRPVRCFCTATRRRGALWRRTTRGPASTTPRQRATTRGRFPRIGRRGSLMFRRARRSWIRTAAPRGRW